MSAVVEEELLQASKNVSPCFISQLELPPHRFYPKIPILPYLPCFYHKVSSILQLYGLFTLILQNNSTRIVY